MNEIPLRCKGLEKVCLLDHRLDETSYIWRIREDLTNIYNQISEEDRKKVGHIKNDCLGIGNFLSTLDVVHPINSDYEGQICYFCETYRTLKSLGKFPRAGSIAYEMRKVMSDFSWEEFQLYMESIRLISEQVLRDSKSYSDGSLLMLLDIDNVPENLNWKEYLLDTIVKRVDSLL